MSGTNEKTLRRVSADSVKVELVWHAELVQCHNFQLCRNLRWYITKGIFTEIINIYFSQLKKMFQNLDLAKCPFYVRKVSLHYINLESKYSFFFFFLLLKMSFSITPVYLDIYHRLYFEMLNNPNWKRISENNICDISSSSPLCLVWPQLLNVLLFSLSWFFQLQQFNVYFHN